MCYDFIYEPIRLASEGASDIEYYLKAILISPLCLALGLFIFATSLVKSEQELSVIKQTNEAFFRKQHKTPEEKFRLVMIYVIVFAIPVITFFWFRYQMAKYGFEVEF
jgi:hypothetical protein